MNKKSKFLSVLSTILIASSLLIVLWLSGEPEVSQDLGQLMWRCILCLIAFITGMGIFKYNTRNGN